MTYQARFQGSKSDLESLRFESPPRDTGALSLLKAVAAIGRWIADRINTSVEYYAFANIYEQLSRLSDAELKRRGLSRDTLARDIAGSRWTQ